LTPSATPCHEDDDDHDDDGWKNRDDDDDDNDGSRDWDDNDDDNDGSSDDGDNDDDNDGWWDDHDDGDHDRRATRYDSDDDNDGQSDQNDDDDDNDGHHDGDDDDDDNDGSNDDDDDDDGDDDGDGTPDPCDGDDDDDGVGDGDDNCPSARNSGQEDWDNDHDGDACEDSDGDGYNDDDEHSTGTDPGGPCGRNGWPSDLVPGGYQPNTINTQDMASFVAPVMRLNTSPGDPNFDARWDLIPGTTFGDWINIQDLAALKSGVTGYPPMLNGAPAFGNRCPAAEDSDSDGVSNGDDNCPLRSNGGQQNWDNDTPGDVCDEGDLDGFLDSAELHVGTSPGQRCGVSGWPADLYGSDSGPSEVDIMDIASYVAPVRRLNTGPGDPNYSARWDVVPGNGGFGKNINIGDVAEIRVLTPAMFGGQIQAFNGPPCQP
jgi:hypothetical protein